MHMTTAYLTSPINANLILVDDDDGAEFLCSVGSPCGMRKMYEDDNVKIMAHKEQRKLRNAVLRQQKRDKELEIVALKQAKLDAVELQLRADFLKWAEANIAEDMSLDDDVSLGCAAKWLGIPTKELYYKLKENKCHPVYTDYSVDFAGAFNRFYNVGSFLFWYYKEEYWKKEEHEERYGVVKTT